MPSCSKPRDNHQYRVLNLTTIIKLNSLVKTEEDSKSKLLSCFLNIANLVKNKLKSHHLHIILVQFAGDGKLDCTEKFHRPTLFHLISKSFLAFLHLVHLSFIIFHIHLALLFPFILSFINPLTHSLIHSFGPPSVIYGFIIQSWTQ